MNQRKLLPADSIADSAYATLRAFHPAIVAEVEDAIKRHTVVVVGMAQNVLVARVKRVLKKAGIEFFYLGYGSYFSAWRKRLAIKLWSGYPTFPQVFVNGVLIGGCQETEEAIASGALPALLGK
jgi:glutaredoxin-related protein